MTKSQRAKAGEQLSYDRYREAAHESDPVRKREYDRLGPRYEAIRQLLRARLEAGVTQEALAEAMGTTRSAVSRLESGRHAPSVDTLSEAAAALGYDIEIRLVPQVRPSRRGKAQPAATPRGRRVS